MKLAFVFPGQGSQSVGMLRDYLDLPVVRTTIDEASSALGQDLFALVENGPEEALNQTTNTQPIMLAADIAVYRAWQSLGGPAPVLAAGHSLGEYAALVAGGALGFAEAMKLVRVRADAMQQAVPEGQGGIAAILGLDADQELRGFGGREQAGPDGPQHRHGGCADDGDDPHGQPWPGQRAMQDRAVDPVDGPAHGAQDDVPLRVLVA